MLSAFGDFECSDDAAITGDITVDGEIRSVGEVPTKVHGAALDHMKLVVIPPSDIGQLDDAYLLAGPAALWETEIFSADTIDQAIALTRKDREPKLMQAMAMFADLKEKFADKTPQSLSAPDAQSALARILELAPNDVSATYLQQLAAGKRPTHLTLQTSIEQAFEAVGPMRTGLSQYDYQWIGANDSALADAEKNLHRIAPIADGGAQPVLNALDEFCQAYAHWGDAKSDINGSGMEMASKIALERTARKELQGKSDAVHQALQKLISDPQVIDQLLRE